MIAEFIKLAHKASEFLPINLLNPDSGSDVFDRFWDPAHVENETLPVLVVRILSSYKRKDLHVSGLVEATCRDKAFQSVNGSANDLH